MSGVGPAVVTGAASSFPGSELQADLWRDHFGPHFGHSRMATRIFAAAGVERRHAVANPRVEDVSGWSTGARMERYVAEAVPLGKDALAGALDAAALEAAELGLLAVVSCTGYATPGVDVQLSRDLGMAETVQRLFVGHMGCFAALPGLGAVADFVVARGRPAALVCVELPSLHAQPPTDDVEQIVAHALFSDAAAALVVEPAAGRETGAGRARRPGALEVVDVAARTDFATADYMTWDVTDLGFRMGLSRQVPDVLAAHVGPIVDGLLAKRRPARRRRLLGRASGRSAHLGGRRGAARPRRGRPGAVAPGARAARQLLVGDGAPRARGAPPPGRAGTGALRRRPRLRTRSHPLRRAAPRPLSPPSALREPRGAPVKGLRRRRRSVVLP